MPIPPPASENVLPSPCSLASLRATCRGARAACNSMINAGTQQAGPQWHICSCVWNQCCFQPLQCVCLPTVDLRKRAAKLKLEDISSWAFTQRFPGLSKLCLRCDGNSLFAQQFMHQLLGCPDATGSPIACTSSCFLPPSAAAVLKRHLHPIVPLLLLASRAHIGSRNQQRQLRGR